MSDKRLTELETRLDFQDDVIEKLNTVLIAQQQQIEKLDAISKGLADRMHNLAEADNSESESEVPPHY